MLTCREWQGTRLRDGYGVIWRDGKNRRVHRWVWALANGPIPKGMHVLHRCDNPPCYRIDHLFIGTHQDNMDDMWAKGRGRASNRRREWTHCKHGHEFTPENTYVNARGIRGCRACNREAVRRYKARRAAEAQP